MDSLLVRLARGAYAVVVRPIVRRTPARVRRFLIRELAVDSLAANHAVSPPAALPVLPATPEDELYLGYLKAFWVDREGKWRAAITRSRPPSRSSTEMRDLTVFLDARCLQDPSFRGRGIGSHIASLLESTASISGPRLRLVAMVDRDLPPAIGIGPWLRGYGGAARESGHTGGRRSLRRSVPDDASAITVHAAGGPREGGVGGRRI